MKIDRHGRAKILTPEEIQLLFSQGFTLNPLRDRTLFAICLYTACRINECVTLRTTDVYDSFGKVRPVLIIRKGNTKGKLATRTIPVLEDLKARLSKYSSSQPSGFLFPGRHNRGHITSDGAARILREACQRVGIQGVSTHSFRRTALTQMSNAGIPLRVIQEISGHKTLHELYKYLEVRPDQVLGAVSTLSMLSPIDDLDNVGKTNYDNLKPQKTSQ